MKRSALLLCFAGALLAKGNAQDGKQIGLTTTQSKQFAAGGEVLIEKSFGELRIEGWDKDEVEIVVTKRTRKRYKEGDEQRGLDFLNSIEVTAAAESPNRLVLSTKFPERNVLKRPLRGKSNADVTYTLRVPHRVTLSVEHDVGDVQIRGISGDIRATNRIGRVSMELPDNREYSIDARVKLGEVDTDLPGSETRRFLAESYQRESTGGCQIYARVGIGEISIKLDDPKKVDDDNPASELFVSTNQAVSRRF